MIRIFIAFVVFLECLHVIDFTAGVKQFDKNTN